ncbi:receptor-like protein EIX2 [Heracleum sosnowskyi]|uniref:Receptor-like protein EIX2 n=1 Tax=Heracleum sosnowskyi TaxID=360622 RepID=A0AAD8JBU8_9APIA|nr:receptor-like protein EIX2 [Heracleum sosnowskyi]
MKQVRDPLDTLMHRHFQYYSVTSACQFVWNKEVNVKARLLNGEDVQSMHINQSTNQKDGSFPYQIGNLSNLHYLSLGSNDFRGPIPKFIGSLNSLRYLDLSHNSFEGAIPHELGNLSQLQYLNLNSEFSGSTLVVRKSDWLFNLSSLTHLDLSGTIVAPPSIWVSLIQRIPSISLMRLEECKLLAPSCTLDNFSSSISNLHLQGNNINSSIFNCLSHLSGSLEVLDLSYNDLKGRIPQSFGHMTGLTYLDLSSNLLSQGIPNSFGRMTALTYLDLSSNQLSQAIPNSFGCMTALTFLYLSSNQLHGEFPNSLQNLSNLKVVYFSFNNLTGSLPDFTLLSSLTEFVVKFNQLDGYLPTVFEKHSALQILDLSNNHLKGSVPDFTGLSSLESLDLQENEFFGNLPNFTGLSSLRDLHLSNNEFSGSLPDFTGCSSLEVLYLDKNKFTEWGAQSTGSLSSLTDLDLSMNSIESTITETHLSNLSSLKHLSASYNSLTFEFSSEWILPFQFESLYLSSCKLGPKFPNWIRNQYGIGRLDISHNQISDTIPIWFWDISTEMFLLNLSSNEIRGKFSYVPPEIALIDLSSNYFDGPLPPIPADCREINLSKNKFSGTLFSLGIVEDRGFTGGTFGSSGPAFLDISHNQLFGALPDCWMLLPSLGFLNLGYNNFSGRIPTSIGNLGSLETLILRKNKLYGKLPASLRNCRSLGFADFGLNKLSGEVPSWIGEDLPRLYALILKANRFYGSLPIEICHLSNLHFLDLSMNRISGTVPTCFGNFTAMIRKGKEVVEHIYYSDDPPFKSPTEYRYTYFDDVLATWKGQEYEYGSNFAYLKMIDLSTNNLTGEIPIGITRLLELKGLNLSGNRFYGEVPVEIGELKVLESLDLSTNKFSGEIPSSMSGLNFLAFLNLSSNNFSGKIPSGTQLQGFNTSTYDGNTELCGKPLTNICPIDNIGPSSSEYEVDEDSSEYKRWLCIGGVLGFSTSFWGIMGTLVLNQRWRHAYYLSLYKLKERFYVAIAVHIGKLQRKV